MYCLGALGLSLPRIEPYCRADVATHWDEVVESIGLGYLRRHDLRHTGLTWMADAGVPVHHLRKIAGHGSLSTTQRYLHPDHDAVLGAGELLSNYIRGSQRGPALRAV